jgi:DNA invertase Pin-like site-specific DNA recombinase
VTHVADKGHPPTATVCSRLHWRGVGLNRGKGSALFRTGAVTSLWTQQGLDTGTPAGKAMFQMLGVFSEFERAMIVERVKSGLARARSQGKRLGRRPVSTDLVERIREHLATGAGILKTAKALGVGTGTVHRVKRSMTAVAA